MDLANLDVEAEGRGVGAMGKLVVDSTVQNSEDAGTGISQMAAAEPSTEDSVSCSI